ncbi:MAG: HTH-type transcriptional activator RhaR [Chroococcidiopsis sp. SAG 2025]|uniref:AraC family transcriptional regulator n=1 Tax=Chroococcidiopsis sp. SAG 2025 TaxID=171389 RepID=UPI002936EC5B|nr:AraC family transcriptional regulator [Chroococcidiopsis sp. SAG 2025]MDV2998233.1 HTH-type transcriptional activator RhaR [Chroococcidiopsis sp. SAG 2025]
MTLDLTIQEVDEIWIETEQQCPPVTSIDRLEAIYTMPSLLGSGYHREMELHPGLDLCIFNATYNNLTIRGVENRHLVQFMVHLSGVIDSGHFLYLDATQSYIGGSGIQPAVTSFHPAKPQVGLDVHLQPHLLKQFFATPTGELLPELQPLVQGDDWQQTFSTKTSGAMRSVVQQIVDCPFLGAAKRFYLQGKVFELIALQLHSMMGECASAPDTSLKPSTIARIHRAAEILRSHLEHPPSQLELARQVGVGHCTLHKGFRSLFGVTPFAYLTQQRMEQAERLLRQPHSTVAEVANRVGYANSAQFAAAFKRQFGITPSDCVRGRKIVP